MTFVEKNIPEFEENWVEIGPQHPSWNQRVREEIKRIYLYHNYLKHGDKEPWFNIIPSREPKYKFMLWEGFILVPNRKEINFEIRLLLTSNYPKVCPRIFAIESISDYSGKLYAGNMWEQDGIKYIMICHDTMSEREAWKPTLGIVHFFIKEVFYWWASQQQFIIQQWEKLHNNHQ